MKRILSFCAAACILASCAEIKPAAPQVEVVKPGPGKQNVSVIDIPIRVELKPYFQQADASVPNRFEGKEEHCEGTSYSYVFERQPIAFTGKGSELQFDIDGKYALKMNYCPSCTDMFAGKPYCVTPRIYASCGVGEPMRRIGITYASKFELKPDFSLHSETRLKEVKPIDRCEVTVFSFDATNELMKEVKKSLKSMAGEIDQQVSATNIRKEVEKAWKTMSQPFRIDQYGYLYIQPEKISVSNFQLNGSLLSFSIAMEAYPKVQLTKSTAASKTLPALSPYMKNDGFNINLDLSGNYDSLSRLLSSELKGKEIMLKKNKIIIDSARIFGAANQQLSFEIAFSGKRSGIIYLLGTPTFDNQKQEVSFPDLTFDLQTKNALLKSAKWLFNDKITQTIRQYSIYSIKDLLKDASARLEKELNRKIDEKTALGGKMSVVQVEGIYPLEKELLIRTNLQGSIRLSVD